MRALPKGIYNLGKAAQHTFLWRYKYNCSLHYHDGDGGVRVTHYHDTPPALSGYDMCDFKNI